MRLFGLSAPVFLFLAIPRGGAMAQEAHQFEAGDRIRVLAEGGKVFLRVSTPDPDRPGGLSTRLSGRVMSVEGEGIRIEGPRRGDVWLAPPGSVKSLWLSRGRIRHPWKGALLGSAVGAVLGAIHCMATCGTAELTPSNKGPFGALYGIALGFPVGLILGTVFVFEDWEEVDPEAFVPSLSVAPGGRLGVGFSLRGIRWIP